MTSATCLPGRAEQPPAAFTGKCWHIPGYMAGRCMSRQKRSSFMRAQPFTPCPLPHPTPLPAGSWAAACSASGRSTTATHMLYCWWWMAPARRRWQQLLWRCWSSARTRPSRWGVMDGRVGCGCSGWLGAGVLVVVDSGWVGRARSVRWEGGGEAEWMGSTSNRLQGCMDGSQAVEGQLS